MKKKVLTDFQINTSVPLSGTTARLHCSLYWILSPALLVANQNFS